MKKSNLVFAIILFVFGIAAFVMILVCSYFANRAVCADYKQIKEADLTQEYTGTIQYNDQLYVQVGYGIIIDPADSHKEEQLSEFISSRMYKIDQRIFAGGCIYIMMISAVLAFPLYQKFRKSRFKHILAVCLLGIGLFILYVAAIAAFRLAFHVPLYRPHFREMMIILSGLLSTLGGSCALAMLLRGFRFRKIAAILAIPLVYFLFLFSSLAEAGLYSEPQEDSFAYVAEIDERLQDENFDGAYYDPDKNMLIIEDKAYPPEQIDNPVFLRGIKRYGAFAYEVLNPYSGTSLPLIELEIEKDISLPIYGGYAAKAVIWIVLAFLCSKREPYVENAGKRKKPERKS